MGLSKFRAIPLPTLSTTLSVATGTLAITSISVNPLVSAVANGDSILLSSGGTTQTITASAAAAVGATTITVTSFTPSINFPIGTIVRDTTQQTGLIPGLAIPMSFGGIAIYNTSTTAAVAVEFYDSATVAAGNFLAGAYLDKQGGTQPNFADTFYDGGGVAVFKGIYVNILGAGVPKGSAFYA